MSRFIPEGKSDMKALEQSEALASAKYESEEKEKEAVSLYEQMRRNHIIKEKEFQEKVKQRNQLNKIGERELRFYQELEKKKEEKELSKKREIEGELSRFESLKKSKLQESKSNSVAKLNLSKTTSIKKKVTVKPKITKTKESIAQNSPKKDSEQRGVNIKQSRASRLVTGYSSSSEEED
ncbi:Fyv6p CYBJADRAFT_169037 [Cyberlindnera jadinii NRRL Y-1542]|uniref:FAM192A/Fyv6 N-terminal domain-containing protein n=1 Tax=Cyberlindnera jadinii (strain ATCC 18201 / CBS 1600 / BCRC 20928 / JCM 3617 / NBRC 0987 / NRRL Y-1542) TaxID=983966 RepID=A0A1E4RXR8_CYBJN|nr:hypothetical protein CYBJADRAFT_169037 [Cyberlindnera jadinii NRRL Y-1542]ODV72020.1 hypothetical protein CYBJADRAFT_169037 [Cyberlindnera jadinii NRRL Y-1542]